MIYHHFEVHQSVEEKETNNNNTNNEKFENNYNYSNNLFSNELFNKLKRKKKKNSIQSYLVRPGEFLHSVQYDPYYNYSNFEKVTVKKKTHVLGSGAFGDVYLVKHKEDGKLFAVKQMNKEKIKSTGADLDIVRREIEIHKRLVHENIVRL